MHGWEIHHGQIDRGSCDSAIQGAKTLQNRESDSAIQGVKSLQFRESVGNIIVMEEDMYMERYLTRVVDDVLVFNQILQESPPFKWSERWRGMEEEVAG